MSGGERPCRRGARGLCWLAGVLLALLLPVLLPAPAPVPNPASLQDPEKEPGETSEERAAFCAAGPAGAGAWKRKVQKDRKTGPTTDKKADSPTLFAHSQSFQSGSDSIFSTGILPASPQLNCGR